MTQTIKVDYDFVVSMLSDEEGIGYKAIPELPGVVMVEDRFTRLANRQELILNLKEADGENLRRRLVAELEKKQEQEVGEDLCPKCFVPWGARMVTRHGGGCYWSEVEAEGCPECGREKD